MPQERNSTILARAFPSNDTTAPWFTQAASALRSSKELSHVGFCTACSALLQKLRMEPTYRVVQQLVDSS